jgi:hypothetical protein
MESVARLHICRDFSPAHLSEGFGIKDEHKGSFLGIDTYYRAKHNACNSKRIMVYLINKCDCKCSCKNFKMVDLLLSNTSQIFALQHSRLMPLVLYTRSAVTVNYCGTD